jgi:hypothetical protein
MNFSLYIECDNDAFTEGLEQEVSRILDDLSHRLYRGERFDRVSLYDINGNYIGKAEFSE